MRRIGVALLALFVGVAIGVVAVTRGGGLFARNPEVASIAQASLDSVRAQNRLVAFAARFTVAVTSEASRLGLTARKTMIVPGDVRYELDWTKLDADDLRWDEATRTLLVTLPPVELSEPAVDLRRIREYQDGRLLMALGNAERTLDTANRAKVRDALAAEARAPVLMRMARDATRAAVERTFALPLAATGVDARVVVRFADEAGRTS